MSQTLEEIYDGMKPSHVLYMCGMAGKIEIGQYGRCVICGGRKFSIVGPVNEWVSGNFTAWSRLYDGEGVCRACAYALKEPAYRKYSYLATPDELIILQHTNTVPVLMSLPDDKPYIFILTTSYKKHLWPLAAVNYGNAVACLQFDEMHIYWNAEVCNEYVKKVEKLRMAGLTREEIAAVSVSAARMAKMNEELWQVVRELEPMKGTPLMKFLAHVARKEEKA